MNYKIVESKGRFDILASKGVLRAYSKISGGFKTEESAKAMLDKIKGCS